MRWYRLFRFHPASLRKVASLYGSSVLVLFTFVNLLLPQDYRDGLSAILTPAEPSFPPIQGIPSPPEPTIDDILISFIRDALSHSNKSLTSPNKMPATNPSLSHYNGFRIDWDFYRRHLASKSHDALAKNPVEMYNNQSLPFLNTDHFISSQHDTDDTQNTHDTQEGHETRDLTDTITWNNPNYFGYCRSYFYSHLAFAHVGHENGLAKHALPRVQELSRYFANNPMDPSLDANFPLLSALHQADALEPLLTRPEASRAVWHVSDEYFDTFKELPPWLYDSFAYYNTSDFYYNSARSNAAFERKFDLTRLKKTNNSNNTNNTNNSQVSNVSDVSDAPDAPNASQEDFNLSDAKRVEEMRSLQTKYRFDSAVLTHNPLTERYHIEVIVARNGPDVGPGAAERFEDIPYNLALEDVKRGERLYYPQGAPDAPDMKWVIPGTERIEPGIGGNRFLCVFSNGATILSNPVRRGNELKHQLSHFIIECDITDQEDVLDALLSGRHGVDDRGRKGPIITNVGLTLFSMLYKESSRVLYNEFLISLNTQLPVCATMEINRKPSNYKDSKQYHEELGTQYHRVKPIVRDENKNENGGMHGMDASDWREEALLKPVQTKVKYELAATTFIHPAARSGQMEILVQQWVDYHLFQGFGHFYLFDHLIGRDDSDITLFYDTLKSYMDDGVVTLIQWPVTVKAKERRNYEVSGYLDATRRFRYDTKLLSMIDVDEWVMIVPKDANRVYDGMEDANNGLTLQPMPTISQLIAMSNDAYGLFIIIGYTSLQDLFGIWHGSNTQGKQLGCSAQSKDTRFDTFLERQSCMHYKLQNKDVIKLFAREFNIFSIPSNNTLNTTLNTTYTTTTTTMAPEEFDDRFEAAFASNPVMILDQLRDKMSNLDIVKSRKDLDSYTPSDNETFANLISLDNLNDPNLSDEFRMHQKQLLYFDFLNEDEWWLGFQMNPKLLINPMLGYCGFQHDMSLYNTHTLWPMQFEPVAEASEDENSTENGSERRLLMQSLKEMISNRHESESGEIIKDMHNDDWQPSLWEEANVELAEKYEVILVHTTDHWRTLGFYDRDFNKMIDFGDKEDIKLLYETIGSECDYQGYILEWNQKFLKSQHGRKWANSSVVNALFSEDGQFCYDTDPNYIQKWKDE